jgi:hypothetical protein
MAQILAEPRRKDTKSTCTKSHPCSAARSFYGQSKAIGHRADAQLGLSSISGKQAGRGDFKSGRCDQVPCSSDVKQKGGVPVRDRQTTEGVMKFFSLQKPSRSNEALLWPPVWRRRIYRAAAPAFRHSHGGTGCGSAHNPFRPACASFSNPSSIASPGAYFRYHQHQPSLTSA